MDEARPGWWRRTNWWEVAFFVVLLAFELAREVAVLEADDKPKVLGSATVTAYEGFVNAAGRWTRVDGGSPIVPSSTVIQCDRDRAECVEVTASMFNGYLTEPELSTFAAKFSPEGVSYENDLPGCASYRVRVDVQLKKVFAVREKKPEVKSELCSKLEKRVEMTLGDGNQPDPEPLGDHFVPLVRLLGWVV